MENASKMSPETGERPAPAERVAASQQAAVPTEHHYIVSNSDGVWQFSALGNIHSHYASQDDAVAAAIAAARQAGEPGALVIVQETNREQSTVWRADDGGA